MCILCEEPFRTLLIAFAALGAVTLVRLGHKGLRRVMASQRATVDRAS
jgi:hypothetical protein